MIDEEYLKRLQQAESFYLGKAREELHDSPSRILEKRAKVAQKLGEHLQSTESGDGKCIANIGLKTDALLSELNQLGVDIQLRALRGYLLDIAKFTHLEIILGDYRARLRKV